MSRARGAHAVDRVIALVEVGELGAKGRASPEQAAARLVAHRHARRIIDIVSAIIADRADLYAGEVIMDFIGIIAGCGIFIAPHHLATRIVDEADGARLGIGDRDRAHPARSIAAIGRDLLTNIVHIADMMDRANLGRAPPVMVPPGDLVGHIARRTGPGYPGNLPHLFVNASDDAALIGPGKAGRNILRILAPRPRIIVIDAEVADKGVGGPLLQAVGFDTGDLTLGN